MNDTCAGHQQYRQCHQLRVESRRRRIRRGRRFCQSVALDHSGQLGLVVDSRGGVLEPTPRSIDEFGQLGLDDVEPSQTLVVESDGTRKIGRRCLGRGSLVVEFLNSRRAVDAASRAFTSAPVAVVISRRSEAPSVRWSNNTTFMPAAAAVVASSATDRSTSSPADVIRLISTSISTALSTTSSHWGDNGQTVKLDTGLIEARAVIMTLDHADQKLAALFDSGEFGCEFDEPAIDVVALGNQSLDEIGIGSGFRDLLLDLAEFLLPIFGNFARSFLGFAQTLQSLARVAHAGGATHGELGEQVLERTTRADVAQGGAVAAVHQFEVGGRDAKEEIPERHPIYLGGSDVTGSIVVRNASLQ